MLAALLQLTSPPQALPNDLRAREILSASQRRVTQRTDRMFAWLLGVEYLAAVATALVVSPRAWAGSANQIHLHVWAAMVLGGVIVSLPLALAILCPGQRLTRHLIAAAQMLMSALFIHLSGGRIETHFHVFGSLAFLAFYRDWGVLLTATGVVAVDHLLRGVYWPQSAFGTLVPSHWRWLEHAAWALFEVFFLLLSCREYLREMWSDARQQAVLENAEDVLVRAALIDKLTGLPNRTLLLDRLQEMLLHAEQTQYDFAVMFLDFDRFKMVNDSLGHDVGDALLQEIAQRLRTQLRSDDTVSRHVRGPSAARMGGDEFVVLLDAIQSPDDAAIVAKRLLAAFAAPYRLGQHEVFSTASIGIVIGDATYQRPEDLLRDADTAMYEAKRNGKARYVIFDEQMRKRLQRHAMLENDLRRAIAGEQLHLAYQPIVSLDTGELKSVEALLRWRHPTEGIVSPAEFIPIAEESDLILSIGDWVLAAGIRQMADWVGRLGSAAPPTISLNLSRKQFVRTDLPEQIRTLAQAADLPLARIQLEVTEDSFASDVPTAIAAMRAIKALGVKLAIDDFGTGCSSFASLHEFPVDVLKIDRSLLTGIEESKDTAALVHALAILVRNLGLVMVAEGIETEANVITLRELGCQYGQGYYFARPQTPADFEQGALERCTSTGIIAGAAAFQSRWLELTNHSPSVS